MLSGRSLERLETALAWIGREPETFDVVDARASFDAALAFQPDLADAHENRADVLCELGRLDEAVESYDRALALAPPLGHSVGRIDEDHH